MAAITDERREYLLKHCYGPTVMCEDCGKTDIKSEDAAWADDGTPFCQKCAAGLLDRPDGDAALATEAQQKEKP